MVNDTSLDNTFTCPWCAYTCMNIQHSLRIHCAKLHKKSSQELYDALHLEKVLCACGCGEQTHFHGLIQGYAKYLPSHHIRVINPWGHNKVAMKKSQEKRREMWKNGEIVPWAKGLSKETDERVANLASKGRETILADKDELHARSERMREHRQNGTIRTLYGKDHSQWRGGVSSLQGLCRSYLHMKWTYPKLLAAQFKCEKCSSIHELNVHHDGERFADIVRRVSSELGWDGDRDKVELKTKIATLVAEYHVENDVSGIVVCHECHKAIHEALGERIL